MEAEKYKLGGNQVVDQIYTSYDTVSLNTIMKAAALDNQKDSIGGPIVLVAYLYPCAYCHFFLKI